MKIIIAPDSYKGNMRAARVCEIIQDAVLREAPGAETRAFPMADGGEGTVDAVLAATGGELQTVPVTGPLGGVVEASYGVLPDGTAIMEMASAAGIELIEAERLNPMRATTYGVGELLRHLIAEGHESIVMGVGGSATVDGGVGMARALGFEFFNAEGDLVTTHGGAALAEIASFKPVAVNARLRVACDVTNPLTGPDGAAAVFGPQKGATPEMVERLDAGLAGLREVVGVEGASGDGAAGGLGYGLRAFCGAEIVSGARLIAETVGLPEALEGADLLITGEGRTDGQTASGKLCSVLAGMARARGVKTMLVSGALQGELEPFLDVFDYAFSISSGHVSLERCIANAPADLSFTVRNATRLLYN